MDSYTISLFGHREIEDLIEFENKLTRIVKKLLSERAYITFLIGRNGEFDEYAASVIKRVRRGLAENNSEIILILPYKIRL